MDQKIHFKTIELCGYSPKKNIFYSCRLFFKSIWIDYSSLDAGNLTQRNDLIIKLY